MIETSKGVQTYSKANDGNEIFYINGRKSNFKVKEFACKDGSDKILIDMELVEKLQVIRDRVGKPVTVNSGYRTATHNAKVGGATKSQHLLGKAADIKVSGYPAETLAVIAEEVGFRGIGIYTWGIHVDTRETKTKWTN